MCLIIVFLGWQGVNFFLESDQQVANKTEKTKAKSSARKRAKNKAAEAKKATGSDAREEARQLSQSAIEKALKDCTISAAARTTLSQPSGKGRKFDTRDYTLAVLSIQSFQRKFRASNVTTRIEASNTKRKMAERLLLPELIILQSQVGQYSEIQSTMKKDLAHLQEEQRRTQDGRRLQNRVVAGVNQGIRIRNDIDEIEARLRDGPKAEDLILVDAQVALLTSMLGEERDNAPNVPSSNSAGESFKATREVTTLTGLDPVQLEERIGQLAKSNFEPITAAIAKSTPDLKRYQIQNATKTLSEFVGLLTVLRNTSNKIYTVLDREQLRVNNKLENLLGKSEAAWLDYTPCLKGKT